MTHPDAQPVLRDVIESFLRFHVIKVEVRDVELPISDINEKRERFDVNCVIDDGSQADVEMQADAMKGDSYRNDHKIIKDRAIYNLCDLHSGQSGRGVRFDKMMRSFQMTFCGYTIYQDSKEFIRRFSFKDEYGVELSDSVGIIFVELSKLNDVVKKPIESLTREEQWSAFFAYGGDPQFVGLIDNLSDARGEIKMARELLQTISRDENERARFRSRRMFLMDMEHNLIAARDEGLLEGRLEGRNEGRDEMSLEIALKMLIDNYTIDDIIKMTGLTRQEIENLQKLS